MKLSNTSFFNILFSFTLAATLVLSCGCNKSEPESGAPLPEAAVNTNVSANKSKPELAGLVGRWLRPDAGYVLDIRSANDKGELDVTYTAPRLVRVGKAVATQAGGRVQVVIELSDPTLAGSKYTLTLDPQASRLNGIYYQAALNENFDIFFVRAQ